MADELHPIEGATGDGRSWSASKCMPRSSPTPSSSPARRPRSAPSRTPRCPGRCGHARHAARDQPRMHPPGGAHRAGARGGDQPLAVFDRKNYFYADLPPGYQISQLYTPDRRQGRGGSRSTCPGGQRQAGRHRADPRGAGRRQEPARPASDQELCRSQPLGRRPDGDRLRARHELAGRSSGYTRKLRAILRYLGSCDGNMEEGSMRADVNVSVRIGGELGTRSEIKNVNSIRFVMAAIEYEARRQVELIEEGGHGPAGNAPLRSGQGRDPPAALQGACARLPLFPRPGPACRWSWTRPSSSNPRLAARAARRQAQAVRRAGDQRLQALRL